MLIPILTLLWTTPSPPSQVKPHHNQIKPKNVRFELKDFYS
jgi:hypothetical protein